MPLRIAVYGKGGIGKSTVSSNISYCLSAKGLKVVQIGCDPKHDSTRPLTGKSFPTVLETMLSTKASERRLEDMVAEGVNGILCIEAGGPEPGIGCAGKGIMTMFHTLETLGLDGIEHDVKVFDVLGDVVCGGFAVPMRPDNSDMVVLVTSGEFMSLYAANNIMKGLKRFEQEGARLAGLVFNSRGSPKEESLVETFSRSTGVPILARIPRSDVFRDAEETNRTVSEMFPGSDEAGIMSDLADRLVRTDPSKDLVYPSPLTDPQMEDMMAGKDVGKGEYTSPSPKPPVRPNVFIPPIRIGRGPIGAAIEAGRVVDIPVVVHGTDSCGSSMLREIEMERDSRMDRTLSTGVNNVFCTGIGGMDTVFGGKERLENLLESLAKNSPHILVITTCLADMVGEDVEGTARRVERKNPGTVIHVIGGNRAEQGADSHLEVVKAFCSLIDESVEPSLPTVSIVDDSFMTYNRGHNRRVMGELVKILGLELGPELVNGCTLDELINAKRSKHIILCEDTNSNREIAEILKSKGMKVKHRFVPRGHRDTVEWLRHIAKMFSGMNDPEKDIAMMEREYLDGTSRLNGLSKNKIVLLNDGTEPIRWIEETLRDCNLDATVFDLGRAKTEHVLPDRTFPSLPEALDAIGKDDVVIGKTYLTEGLGSKCMDFPETYVGSTASILFMKDLESLISSKNEEGWKKWREPL